MEQQLKNFNYFLNALIQRYDPMQVICFGHHHTVDHLESFFIGNTSIGRCDYFLLLIMKAPACINHQLQDFANRHYDAGTITILVHSEQAISESINLNNRFFQTVINQGRSLYRKGEFNLKSNGTVLPADSSFDREKFYFEHHMQLASGFMSGATECLAGAQYNVCAFNLHQVVEQCCMALLYVYLDYRSNIHNLKRMLSLCCCFSNRPLKLFLSGSAYDARLFEVLVKSYSKSRYRIDFVVNAADAMELYDKVVCLIEMTRQMVTERTVVAHH